MKLIIQNLKSFLESDFHPKIYGFSLLFITIAIIFNFSIDFEDSWVDPQGYRWFGWFMYMAYYGVPYFLIIFFIKTWDKSINLDRSFWITSLFAIGLLSFKAWFHFEDLIMPRQWFENQYIFFKISRRVANMLIYFIGLGLFYKVVERYNRNFYGLATPEFNYRPFFILLALMLPLIFWASFQPDFLATYPRLHPSQVPNHYFKWFFIFEPFYLLEFVTLEWFFRGFLILGFSRSLGHRAILPMAVLYCVFHFGKPLGECIGSLFGGFILGIISYKTRSVWGGIIVHMGVALFMDLFAILSHFVFRIG